MKRFTGTKGFICLLVLILLVVGYYYYLSNRQIKAKHEANVKLTDAQELLLTNFEVNYPPTPKEVVKEYLEFTKVLHNSDLTDEDTEALAKKIQEIYDTELVNNKSEEDYLKDLKSELISFKNNDYSIVNYYTSSSTEVNYFETDGYDCASLYGTYNIRTSSGTQVLSNIFILRKDEAGRWKIYGWQPIENEAPTVQ
ncbi:MAG: hypothetical protein KBT19_07000 [Lachnospiraceae bacterium]|nr:hypothetical protein [Candidatus Colinaster equi]